MGNLAKLFRFVNRQALTEHLLTINVQKPVQANADDEDEDEDGDGSSSDDQEDTELATQQAPEVVERHSHGARIRAERNAKRKSDQAELVRMAAQRRSKNVNINSGRSSLSGSPLAQMSNQTCHSCGKSGHLRRDCPNGGQERGRKR